jgi:hypothetical protein
MKSTKVQFPYLLAWDIMMGSYRYWRELNQARAAEDNAPATAIYRDAIGWRTYEEIPSPDTKALIDSIMEEYGLA